MPACGQEPEAMILGWGQPGRNTPGWGAVSQYRPHSGWGGLRGAAASAWSAWAPWPAQLPHAVLWAPWPAQLPAVELNWEERAHRCAPARALPAVPICAAISGFSFRYLHGTGRARAG